MAKAAALARTAATKPTVKATSIAKAKAKGKASAKTAPKITQSKIEKHNEKNKSMNIDDGCLVSAAACYVGVRLCSCVKSCVGCSYIMLTGLCVVV